MANTKTRFGKIPIFCINLERRQDRWREFIGQKGLLGLDIKRWQGVDGSLIDITNDPRVSMRVKRNIRKKLRRSWEDIYTPGAVGCYLSHMEIWKWLSTSDSTCCIVLEDDCVIPDNFAEKITTLWEESEIIQNERYDCCILHRRCGKVETNSADANDDKVEAIEWFFNTTGYIITRNCAKKLMENALPIQVHVDKYIGLYKLIYNLKIYRVRENWLNITSSQSISDIDSKDCDLCRIPSNFTETHRAVEIYDFYLGRISQVVIIVMLGVWSIRGIMG
jgi:GR25 family glycosyltransferase involved in LPS biosynthesis